MTLKPAEVQLLKCMYDHGYYGGHHKMLVTIQKVCFGNVRKGLRNKLRRLESHGYVQSKGYDHFSVTPEGRDFLSDIGEI
jgi:ribosomal protein S19E (S16A)